MIWKRLNEDSAAWQTEQRRIRDQANAKRSEAAKTQHQVSNPRIGESSGLSTFCGRTKSTPRGQGSQAKAAASKTNRGTVERMDKLDRDRPDLAAKVLGGELSSTEAVQTMRRDEVRAKLEDVSAREVKAMNSRSI